MSKRRDVSTFKAHAEELALYLLKQQGFVPEKPNDPYPYGNPRGETYMRMARDLLNDWQYIRRAALKRADREEAEAAARRASVRANEGASRNATKIRTVHTDLRKGEQMTERPIPFTAPMVQANREGRKTETRRMAWRENMTFTTAEPPTEADRHQASKSGVEISHQKDGRWRFRLPTPYRRYKPGDILWVREAYRLDIAYDDMKPSTVVDTAAVWCEADGANIGGGVAGKLRPAMFMPRWASRDSLEVLAVRVEPLHAITEEGALAEGVTVAGARRSIGVPLRADLRGGYAQLFDRINGPGSWDKNPDVVVISYKRIE